MIAKIVLDSHEGRTVLQYALTTQKGRKEAGEVEP